MRILSAISDEAAEKLDDFKARHAACDDLVSGFDKPTGNCFEYTYVPNSFGGIVVVRCACGTEWVCDWDENVFDRDATDAWVSLHQKGDDGSWHMVMTTPGFIGKNGLDKAKEGDAKTPTGVFHFNRAFGIADDPGCAIPYVKVDDNTYWSADPREGFHYNELVNLADLPGLDVESGDSEHIVDHPYHYQYCLNISYNEEGTPGLGSAIFLHCLGPAKPFTGGCVAIPEDQMRFVMQRVDENTAVVIDTYEALAGTDEWPSSTWPQER